MICGIIIFASYPHLSAEEVARREEKKLLEEAAAAAKEAAQVASYLKPVIDELQQISGNLSELRAGGRPPRPRPRPQTDVVECRAVLSVARSAD